MIVEFDVPGNAFSGLSRIGVIVKIDFLVFETAPKPFGKNVVHSPSFPIHADADLFGFQQFDVLWTGKMAALIAIPDFRLIHSQSGFHRFQDEIDLQALVQLPGDDIPGIPIKDGDQIHPAALQSDVSQINDPHLIRPNDVQTSKQIRINAMLQMAFVEIGTRIDGGYPHLLHVTLNRAAVDTEAFIPSENRGDAPGTEHRVLGIDPIDGMFDGHFFRRRRSRLVI